MWPGMTERRRVWLAGVLALAGCSGAPAYHPPTIDAPAQFREAGPWVQASPGEPAADWWRALGDPVLDDLEQRLSAQNPALALALARHDEAAAGLAEARSQLYPTIGAGSVLSANRQSDTRPLRGSNQPDLYGSQTVGGVAGYELDLWGRVRNSVAAGRAREQASADDAAYARLALQADLARAVITLRGLDRQAEVLRKAVATYDQADRLTRNRFKGGIADGIDVGRSGAQLASAQAQLADVANSRALVEHAIASLIGVPASGFALEPSSQPFAALAIPSAAPSILLQRRPDVAAAERRMFAANRDIGVARAAFFPQILLGGQGGTQSTAIAGLAQAPNLFWSVGPQAVVSLFDGGRRRAAVRAARARWDEAAAQYRQTALGAFQQVEDGYSRLHWLGENAAAQDRAVASATQAASLSYNRYLQGTASLLDLVTAQNQELTARQRAIAVDTARVDAGIGLILALGGG